MACAPSDTSCARTSRGAASVATVTATMTTNGKRMFAGMFTKGSAQHSELRATVALAIPVVFVQLGFMTMGVVDTLMVGRLSPRALAAVAIGNLYYFNVTIFGTGTLMSLDPIVSQALGAGDAET